MATGPVQVTINASVNRAFAEAFSRLIRSNKLLLRALRRQPDRATLRRMHTAYHRRLRARRRRCR